MDGKAGTFAEPGSDFGVSMSAVIIHDQMQCLVTGKLAINTSQKA